MLIELNTMYFSFRLTNKQPKDAFSSFKGIEHLENEF